MNPSIRGHVAPLLAGLLLCIGCSSRNALGRRQVALMPSASLNSQAATLFEKEKNAGTLSQDTRRVALVERVGRRLIAQAEKHYGEHTQGFQWEVVLFEAPETANAYCMPGGKIGFYSGILPVCANEAGVAAVMGHEISHALLDHGNARVTQALGMQALQAVVASKVGGEGDARSTALMAAVGLGGQIGLTLPNSRVHENEADRLGLRLMALAGYDPSEAPLLWERMRARSGGGGPEWLSTHPDEERRIRRLTEFQAESQPLYATASPKYGRGETIPQSVGGAASE